MNSSILFNNAIWITDIDTVSAVIPELDLLAGKNVLITGASGLICSSIVDVFFRYNDTHKGKIHILAAGRNFAKMEERFHEMVQRDDFHFIHYDASCSNNLESVCADYIIHGASNATPNMIMNEPVETMFSNFIGMKYLLEYARNKKTHKVLFVSSSEVYGEKVGSKAYKEDEYGYIDLLKSRSSYSISKRATETLCVSYADEFGVESVIVRPGHIYGPTASLTDNRISSAWAYSVAKGDNIFMKSNGSQIRSYCYCLDCASAILKVLLCGKTCKAYNISNPNSLISIKEMGEILVKSGNVQLLTSIPSKEEAKGFNPMHNSTLDSTELIGLGWKGCFDARTGFSHTVRILKDLIKNQ